MSTRGCRHGAGREALIVCDSVPDVENPLELLGRLTAPLGNGGQTPSIAVRRVPQAVPDAAILMADRAWSETPAGHALLDRLESGAEFCSVRHKAQRLTLRFADDLLAAIGAELEKGRAAGLDGSRLLAGNTYIVDFCDPNATKALHVGHLRNLVIGHALAAAIEMAGGQVLRQSIVCDIGRNVSEAVAGYLQREGSRTPLSADVKSDVFVGRCYADYVRRNAGAATAAAEEDTPDAPIARELTILDDFAQTILQRWIAGDPDIDRTWRAVRAWVLDGQAETLGRLGIVFDRTLYESDTLRALERIVQEGISRGVFSYTPDGVLIYETGQRDYEVVPLVRGDGFPTEHMRALILWYELQQTLPTPTACIHVMGDEWLASTLQREAMLAKLIPCPLFAVYHKIPYGMVSIHGSKMKSSTGEVILIDDLLDDLTACDQIGHLCRGGDHGCRELLARTVIAGFLLSRPALKSLEFSRERFGDERHNPGWTLAKAWAKAHAGCPGDAVDPDPTDADYRFAVLHSQGFPRVLHMAAATRDVTMLTRYLLHIAEWHVAQPRAPRVDRVMRTLLRTGLCSLGVLPAHHLHGGAAQSPRASVRLSGGSSLAPSLAMHPPP
jgi:arginyl-tRNA synthetase